MTIANLPAGRRLRASDLNAIIDRVNFHDPLYKIKATSEAVTSATTGTTFQDDNELFIALEPNVKYFLDMEILYSESAGNIDFKWRWAFPAGCRLDLQSMGPHASFNTTAAANEIEWASNVAVTATPGGGGTWGSWTFIAQGAQISGIVRNGANAGNLQLQWAQSNLSASTLTVWDGSSMKLTRLP